MTTLSVLLGKRIKEIRESKNIKRVELAEKIDMEATNLSKLEKGIHMPKEDNLNRISEALDVDIKELFCFNHFQSREKLLKDISKMLKCATDKEIMFFYKVLMSYTELKK